MTTNDNPGAPSNGQEGASGGGPESAPSAGQFFHSAPSGDQPPEFKPIDPPWEGGIDAAWIFKDDKGNERPWYHMIPDPETREFYEAKGYKNPIIGTMSHKHLQQHLNGSPNVVALPQDGWQESDWARYRNQIGAGDTAEDYVIERRDGVPYDEAALSWLQQVAHKHALPKAVVEDLVNGEGGWNEMMAARAEAEIAEFQAANEKALQEISKEWGENLEPMKAAGQRAIAALKLDDKTMAAIESNIGAAALVDLLARIGAATQEGTFKGGDVSGDPNDLMNMAPEQAEEAANQLMADPAYFNDKDPKHAEVKGRVLKLIERSIQTS